MSDTTLDRIRQLKALADERAQITFTNLAAAAQEAALVALLQSAPETELVRAGLESTLRVPPSIAEEEMAPLLIELVERLLPLYKGALGLEGER